MKWKTIFRSPVPQWPQKQVRNRVRSFTSEIESIASAGAAILCSRNAMSALVSEIVRVNYVVWSVLGKQIARNQRKLRIFFRFFFRIFSQTSEKVFFNASWCASQIKNEKRVDVKPVPNILFSMSTYLKFTWYWLPGEFKRAAAKTFKNLRFCCGLSKV